MKRPFLVYLKSKTSLKFEYKNDVLNVARSKSGYQITFSNGKNYNYGADKVHYSPFVSTRENVRIYEKGNLNAKYNTVDNYGRFLIFRDGDNCSYPIENSSDIEICDIKKNGHQAKSLIEYFKNILEKSGGISFDIPSEEKEDRTPNQISSEILLKALDGLDLTDSRSVLSNYIDGVNPAIDIPKAQQIYPFGCNESQKLAVETTLSNRMSIIEGPPGTGKTQTILNIIANLIVQNKTVAVVSNNNSAVFNVQEKLEKLGYGMVVASLGNIENKTTFFDNIKEQFISEDFAFSKDKQTESWREIQDLDSILTKCFQYRNQLSNLKTELSDAEVEFSHVKSEQPIDQNVQSLLDKKFYRKWNFSKALKMKHILSTIDDEIPLTFLHKLQLIFKYGLLDLNSISKYREALHVYVNHQFYELYISKIKNELLIIEDWLKANNEDSTLKRFIALSKELFNGVLFEKYSALNKVAFNVNDYRNQFDVFSKHYPVILSSTLSLHTSIPKGYLYDYLIIDESSQVDIIKAAVCFSCCRNVVVVGDSMQLTHIIDQQAKDAVEQVHMECVVPSAYDYVEHNILNSLKKLYGNKIKSVLLKEHYRCHPSIIGFCNKKYYNNQLIIMTFADNHPFRIIETKISGGRTNYNQRQIDETDFYIRENFSEDYTKVGVVVPYRKHANMLQKLLPNGAEADTIHKFQGREKEVIIFNTVSNEIVPFIDNPNLINVAVSRAVKEFIVVKPISMELPHGTNIGDLIRYMCYNTDPYEVMVTGKICSVFDLLYKEYSKVFESFLMLNKDKKGSPSEKIIFNLLTDSVLLNNSQFATIGIAREYKLRDLIRDFQLFSEEELRFIKNNSRLDFLLYNMIDKTPILAIEVDGVSFHDNEVQRKRDDYKNHILKTIGLPLLRLSTDGYNEEGRIIENLKAAMGLH